MVAPHAGKTAATAQPRRGFKTADHWVAEGAGTRAQHAELERRGAEAVRAAWARWAYVRRHQDDPRIRLVFLSARQLPSPRTV